jgi:hypothetical protein
MTGDSWEWKRLGEAISFLKMDKYEGGATRAKKGKLVLDASANLIPPNVVAAGGWARKRATCRVEPGKSQPAAESNSGTQKVITVG